MQVILSQFKAESRSRLLDRVRANHGGEDAICARSSFPAGNGESSRERHYGGQGSRGAQVLRDSGEDFVFSAKVRH